MTKTTKTLPTDRGIEFENRTGLHTGLILEDRGICWKVRDDDGEEYQVPKKQVRRFFPEAELEPTPDEHPDHCAGTLSAALGGLINPPAPEPAPAAAKAKKEPVEKDPNLITLQDLCAAYNLVGRIARRRLRKAFGQVGTGSRWEWQKGSDQLDAVIKVLTAVKAAPEEEGVKEEPAPEQEQEQEQEAADQDLETETESEAE